MVGLDHRRQSSSTSQPRSWPVQMASPGHGKTSLMHRPASGSTSHGRLRPWLAKPIHGQKIAGTAADRTKQCPTQYMVRLGIPMVRTAEGSPFHGQPNGAHGKNCSSYGETTYDQTRLQLAQTMDSQARAQPSPRPAQAITIPAHDKQSPYPVKPVTSRAHWQPTTWPAQFWTATTMTTLTHA
jgi:hypothetical protein